MPKHIVRAEESPPGQSFLGPLSSQRRGQDSLGPGGFSCDRDLKAYVVGPSGSDQDTRRRRRGGSRARIWLNWA